MYYPQYYPVYPIYPTYPTYPRVTWGVYNSSNTSPVVGGFSSKYFSCIEEDIDWDNEWNKFNQELEDESTNF